MGRRRRSLVRNLQGQVIGAAGALIATWSMGGIPPHEFTAVSVCPAVVIAQPDGSPCSRLCSHLIDLCPESRANGH